MATRRALRGPIPIGMPGSGKAMHDPAWFKDVLLGMPSGPLFI